VFGLPFQEEIFVATKAGQRLDPHTAEGYNLKNLEVAARRVKSVDRSAALQIWPPICPSAQFLSKSSMHLLAMPIPIAEARKFRVAKLSQQKFESPDPMIKPHIIDFLARNKGKAFSSDEIYQALLPAPLKSNPEPVGLPSELSVKEIQLRVRVARETFFIVKLRELADRGDILASEKDGETYFYVT